MTEPIDLTFTVPVQSDESPGAWTIAVLPDSGRLLGTRCPIKVKGRLDGHPLAATLLPMGNGAHMLPLRAALRTAAGKSAGDQVAVQVTERG